MNVGSRTSAWPCLGALIRVSLIGIWSVAVYAAGPLPGPATPGGVDPSRLQQKMELPVEEQGFSVPSLVERPLGADEGPVIQVEQFVLDGTDGLPELDEPVDAAQTLLEERRAARSGAFTMGQMQELADEATNHFRRQGLILARVVLPAQEIQGGVVRFQLLPGRLGKVLVEGNKRYQADYLESFFGAVIGETVLNEQVEASLLRVTDLPGLTAFGVFQPGENVGEADVVLKVTEDPWDGYVNFDNYGSQFTGEREMRLGLGLNNPLQLGDRLDLMFQKGYHPKLSDFGSFTYQVPLLPEYLHGDTLGAGFSRNRFTVGGPELGSFGIKGVTEIANVSFNHSFLRGRRTNLYGLLDLTRKSAEVDIAGTAASEDKLAILTLQTGFDAIDNLFGGGINSGYIALAHGFDGVLGATDQDDLPGSSRRNSDNDTLSLEFDKLVLEYSRLQNLFPNHSLLLRVAGQWSDDLLVSLEQMAIGGPLSVRAYPQSEFLMDRGVFASVEWIMNAPGFADRPAFENRTWGQLLQVSFYLDHGAGWLRDPSAVADQSIEITGAGLGLNLYVPAQIVAGGLNWLGGQFGKQWQLNFPGDLSLRLDVATPIGTRDATNEENPQTFVNAAYSF